MSDHKDFLDFAITEMANADVSQCSGKLYDTIGYCALGLLLHKAGLTNAELMELEIHNYNGSIAEFCRVCAKIFTERGYENALVPMLIGIVRMNDYSHKTFAGIAASLRGEQS